MKTTVRSLVSKIYLAQLKHSYCVSFGTSRLGGKIMCRLLTPFCFFYRLAQERNRTVCARSRFLAQMDFGPQVIRVGVEGLRHFYYSHRVIAGIFAIHFQPRDATFCQRAHDVSRKGIHQARWPDGGSNHKVSGIIGPTSLSSIISKLPLLVNFKFDFCSRIKAENVEVKLTSLCIFVFSAFPRIEPSPSA